LKLDVPTGKLSDIVRVIPLIKSMFKSDYEDKNKKAIKQSEVKIEEEGLNE